MTKTIEIEIEDGGRIQLPEEVLTLFGNAHKLYLSTKSDTKLVVLSDIDPEIAENTKLLDEIAALNRPVRDEDYFAPVPEPFLKK